MAKRKKKNQIKKLIPAFIAVGVVVIIISSLLILGRSKYERKDLVQVENETQIESHENFFNREWCNIHYRRLVAKFESEVKDNKGKKLFLGDSITEYYDLDKYFEGYDLVNFGISGDTTRGVLNRMDVLYDTNPDEIFINIGINDFMNEERGVDNVYASYKQIIDEIREKLPNTKIYVISTYLGYDGEYELAKYKDDINALNTKLAAYVATLAIKDLLNLEYKISYIDMNSVLEDDETGLLNTLYSDDGCHPNEAGYAVITEKLKNYIKK